jgi:hypothetical protein
VRSPGAQCDAAGADDIGGMSGPGEGRIFVRDTGTPRGRGVFAGREFRAGEPIESCPVVVIEAPFEQLPQALQRMLFSWPAAAASPAVHALALGYGSLYNGANPANLRFERDVARGLLHLVAARNIACGEELTLNYSAADGAALSQDDAWFAEHGIPMHVDPTPPGGS